MPDNPNLLLIHSDQHNPFVTGCYGDGLVQTPNLDRLAGNGVVFDNAYCSSPICVPSRMSMLTCRHPYQNEVWTNEHILDSGIPTFAHALGAAGYRPVLIGRMHALGPDQLHGYVERLVGDHNSNHLGGVPVDRGVLDGTSGPERASLQRSGPGQSPYQVHDEAVTAATVHYLNRIGVQKRSGEPAAPFCLSVGYMLPHPPYVARHERYEVYRDRIAMPKKPKPFSDEFHPHLRWWRQVTDTEDVSEAEARRARAAYWALVAEVDAMIGEILTALENNGLLDNTLIVYTSDHGDMLGEHGLWWKHTFYEESAKVPLILSWPGEVPPGQRCGNVVSALDVTATILDALGAPALPNAAGRSFLKLVNGTETETAWEDEAFTEYCSDEYAPPGGCYQRMVRRGDWKLIYYHGQPLQLFNLTDDPGERTDLANDSRYQRVREELMARVLDGWDPEMVKAKMAAKRADNGILEAWARRTHPTEQYRWDLRPGMSRLEPDAHSSVPSFLQGYEGLYAQNPREATLAWFQNARFGLFMHYGLYSILGRGEWVMYHEAVRLAQYEALRDEFTAEMFDADFITDLALEAGMRYVNFTARHHDSFCLFDSRVSAHNSVHSPAGRDLVAELAEKCSDKGLGLFLYYSYALDWRHPYFYPRQFNPIARPDYKSPEPRYRWQNDEDFQHYVNFVHSQVRELLTQYGPLAGIWFDPIMGYYARPDLFPVHETYALVRELQPQTLIAFKQGATGEEDFASPERHGHSLADRARERFGPEAEQVARRAWERNEDKHNEICDTLQPGVWGCKTADDGQHRTADEVVQMLADANQQSCNLLLNTGPLADGSIHPDDVATLREVGRRLRT